MTSNTVPGARPRREISVHLLPGGCWPWPGHHRLLLPAVTHYLCPIIHWFMLTNLSWSVIAKSSLPSQIPFWWKEMQLFYTSGEPTLKIWHPWFLAMAFVFPAFEKESRKPKEHAELSMVNFSKTLKYSLYSQTFCSSWNTKGNLMMNLSVYPPAIQSAPWANPFGTKILSAKLSFMFFTDTTLLITAWVVLFH